MAEENMLKVMKESNLSCFHSEMLYIGVEQNVNRIADGTRKFSLEQPMPLKVY